MLDLRPGELNSADTMSSSSAAVSVLVLTTDDRRSNNNDDEAGGAGGIAVSSVVSELTRFRLTLQAA